MIKPSVFGSVINWYFFCIQFQAHVVTSKICCSHHDCHDLEISQVELSFSREQCRELQLQVVEALYRAPERYWEHAVDGRWKKSQFIGGYPIIIHYL